jgi:hypothetical protein
MRQILTVLSLLGAAAVTAIAQPPTVQPSTGPQVASPIRLPTARLERAPLTTVQLQAIERRFAAYRDHLLASAPRPDTLLRAGLSEETDVVERASATEPDEIGPTHVGLLTRLSSPPAVHVDPGLVEGLGSSLRMRLGREPSADELAAELKAFDDRIARVNKELAVKRPGLARAMRREGVLPRALERRILGIPDRDPQTDSEQVQKGFQTLIQTLLLTDTGAPDPR